MASKSAVKQARSIPSWVSAVLYANAAGRCEFWGCNRRLTEHHVTLADGNFAERAHIYAYSDDGPRGQEAGRPSDAHSLENLMLLCPSCHKHIDDHPNDFSVALLKKYKRAHEERIEHVTGLGDARRTVVLQLKSHIGGDAVEIPLVDVSRAVAPFYPVDRKGCLIDVSSFDDREPNFCATAARKISRDVERFFDSGVDVEAVRHVSVFALAPIPLLVHLGFCLTNKVATDFFQRHRDTDDWVWKSSGPDVRYQERVVQSGNDPTKIALILSLSGKVSLSTVPFANDPGFTIREITLAGRDPGVDFLRRREDLDQFALTYRDCIASITAAQPDAREIHLFPAIPAPVALRCGYDLLKKAQPNLVIWDFDKASGGFTKKLEVKYDHFQ
jgi:hypothetical protein